MIALKWRTVEETVARIACAAIDSYQGRRAGRGSHGARHIERIAQRH